MNLISTIRHLPAATELLKTNTTSVTAGELSRRHAELSAPASRWQGRRVLIATSDFPDALQAIISLDGIAVSIGFVSPDLQSKAVHDLANQGRFHAVLSSALEQQELRDGIWYVPTLEALMRCEPYGTEPPTIVDNTSWLMSTSGTTGQPKFVSHSLDSLTRTTKRSHRHLNNVRWGMLYDYTRFAGMQVVLQSLLSGSTLLAPMFTAPLKEKLLFFAAEAVTHISATPTLWRRLIMAPEHERLSLKGLTLGGEIVDQHLLNALSRKFPEAQVIHIFASTEAGVGFSVKDCLAGFPTSFLTDPPAGIQLRIKNGVLEIQNDILAPNHLDNEDRPSETQGWISTGDQVTICDNRVHFTGRTSGIINVGGNKVQPELVEEALNSHKAVSMSFAYAKKSPITGELVVADVVLVEPGLNLKSVRRELKAYLVDKLEPYQTPAAIRFVEALDTNASGKIVRK